MKFITLMLSFIILAGCERTVYVTKVEYIYPDDSWLLPVTYTRPYDKQTFNKLVIEKRIKVIGDMCLQESANLAVCNAQLDKVRAWKEETIKTQTAKDKK